MVNHHVRDDVLLYPIVGFLLRAVLIFQYRVEQCFLEDLQIRQDLFLFCTHLVQLQQKTRWNFPSWNLNWMIGCYTLVKFDSKFAPEKRANPKRNFVVQPSIFRCNSLGVREGYHFFPDPEVARVGLLFQIRCFLKWHMKSRYKVGPYLWMEI